MKTSIGLWDRLFGKKVTLELPDSNGAMINRTVTQKWLDQMIVQGRMSTVPRKEQINCTTAAKFVVKKSIDDSRLYWDYMKAEIIDYKEVFGHIREDWIQYEFILAAIGTDMLALYNLFPEIQAEELAESLNEFLGAIEEVGGIYAEAVLEYYHVARQSVSVGEHPLDFVVSLLLERLEVKETESDTILLMGLMSAVSKLIGNWRWIKENFVVI